MNYPTLKEERKLWQKGYKFVACVDEVGRGPLAGPVVAAAVLLKSDFNRLLKSDFNKFNKIRDSKKLSAKQREYWYSIFSSHPAIRWGIGRVSPQVIDRINIYQATKLAMKRALVQLSGKRVIVDFLILDGNMSIDVPISQKSIVKGDEKVFSCAVASIIAKVKRDRTMMHYHTRYPRYGFDKHKGYGTLLHIAMLKKHGPCKIHRRSFHPVRVASI